MMSLLSWEMPDLFYALPCNFNVQFKIMPGESKEGVGDLPLPPLEDGEDEDEYEVVDMLSLIYDGEPPFEEFRRCHGPRKILHLNGSN